MRSHDELSFPSLVHSPLRLPLPDPAGSGTGRQVRVEALMAPATRPRQQVRCRWCGETLLLNPDSEAARAAKTDPLQQLKTHLFACPKINQFQHGFECAIVVQMLAFDSPSDPERWRQTVGLVVDYTLKQPAGAAEISLQPFQQKQVQ
jgi:hypothetical protein